MNQELNLKKEEIFEELFFILKEYGNSETINGMQFMLDNIVSGIADGRTIEDDIDDINYLLNLTISELTSIENDLNKDHRETFNDLSKVMIQMEQIKAYNQGQLIIYDNLPYIINEIDYDDIAIHISSGNMMDSGMWVNDFHNIK